LDEPLGGRVVVDLDATPVVVEASVPDQYVLRSHRVVAAGQRPDHLP
jgi:hypothetical protein